jgi:hypothetical protein
MKRSDCEPLSRMLTRIDLGEKAYEIKSVQKMIVTHSTLNFNR